MSTKLRFKPAQNGFEIIYLDTCFQGRRTYKMLGFKVKKNPKSFDEKHDRKEKIALAQEVAKEHDYNLVSRKLEIRKKVNENVDFIEFANNWINESDGILDIRIYKAAVKKLKKFGGNAIYCYEIDEVFLEKFWRYLNKELNGITPHNYMKKLKILIKAAKKNLHFFEDPTEHLSLKKGKCAEKEYLNFDEINQLNQTDCNNETVKRAALFACNTGLRFCDIKELTWTNINGKTLNIVQAKTKVPVSIVLNENAISLVGERGKSNELIFPLPSHTAVLKSIRQWVKAAGIEKSITFHCFRVSFATNLLITGCDVATASKLLGHTSLLNTDRYIRISESLKQTATDQFPKFIQPN